MIFHLIDAIDSRETVCSEPRSWRTVLVEHAAKGDHGWREETAICLDCALLVGPPTAEHVVAIHGGGPSVVATNTWGGAWSGNTDADVVEEPPKTGDPVDVDRFVRIERSIATSGWYCVKLGFGPTAVTSGEFGPNRRAWAMEHRDQLVAALRPWLAAHVAEARRSASADLTPMREETEPAVFTELCNEVARAASEAALEAATIKCSEVQVCAGAGPKIDDTTYRAGYIDGAGDCAIAIRSLRTAGGVMKGPPV